MHNAYCKLQHCQLSIIRHYLELDIDVYFIEEVARTRHCSGAFIGLYEVGEVCLIRDEMPEDGKIVDCGLRRLEKI